MNVRAICTKAVSMVAAVMLLMTVTVNLTALHVYGAVDAGLHSSIIKPE